jgi:hypothetical protein
MLGHSLFAISEPALDRLPLCFEGAGRPERGGTQHRFFSPEELLVFSLLGQQLAKGDIPAEHFPRMRVQHMVNLRSLSSFWIKQLANIYSVAWAIDARLSFS